MELKKAGLSQTTVTEKLATRIPDILFLTVDEFENVPKCVLILSSSSIPEVFPTFLQCIISVCPGI